MTLKSLSLRDISAGASIVILSREALSPDNGLPSRYASRWRANLGGGSSALHKVPQFSDGSAQLLSFRAEFLGRGCGLFTRGGIFLRDLTHALHRLIDLADALALLLIGGGDLVDQAIHFDRGLLHMGHGFGYVLGDGDSGIAAADTSLDQRTGGFGGLGGPKRQAPDFFGDDGKSLA